MRSEAAIGFDHHFVLKLVHLNHNHGSVDFLTTQLPKRTKHLPIIYIRLETTTFIGLYSLSYIVQRSSDSGHVTMTSWSRKFKT